MCIRRLQGAIRRLGYPQHVVSDFSLPWEAKPKFAYLKAQNHKSDDEVGGLGPKKSAHFIVLLILLGVKW